MSYDVIIIGSGPAGLTAAIYNIRAGFKVLVIAGYAWGGQLMLTTEVENYPGFPDGILGPDLMQKMRQQAENLGVEFIDKDAVEIDVNKRPFKVYTGLNTQIEGRTVIIATGAATKWLDVPGEKELIGKGISSCAPCDAFFFKGKNVIVVGGGDSAMEETLVLARVVNSVAIIHRRHEFRASQIMQDRVFANAKIKVLWNTMVTEVLGKDKVTGVRLRNYSSSEARSQNDSSRPFASNNNTKESEMPIDGVFVAIGHKPNSEKFIGRIDLDDKGYVIRHEQYEGKLLKYWSSTNVDGVFVAGDVHDYRYKQAVTAAGFGCIAGLDAEKWLDEQKG
ncbi:thioredoxin-disulfide reductase [Candidatus Gottesmanbacteria bacterium]|nr:thioredoxin-disulfide reductase [Candidatus Gottesmanbacteria bacterium]